MSEFKTINYEVISQVATIRLNRPKAMNSFNVDLRRDLLAAVNKANNDNNVRVVVIGAEGRGFCAGADLTENFRDFYDTLEEQIIEEYKPFLMAIHNSPKIFISSTQGAVAGIGSALAMVCDLSIMAEDAYIYQAFATIALIPDGGVTWHLVNTLGYRRALEMIIEGEKMPAKTCVELGLANRVVPGEELASATQAWAEKLAAGAPLTQKYSKEVLKKAMYMSLSEVIDEEANKQDITAGSQDHKEGATAFFEKRQPSFIGK